MYFNTRQTVGFQLSYGEYVIARFQLEFARYTACHSPAFDYRLPVDVADIYGKGFAGSIGFDCNVARCRVGVDAYAAVVRLYGRSEADIVCVDHRQRILSGFERVEDKVALRCAASMHI